MSIQFLIRLIFYRIIVFISIWLDLLRSKLSKLTSPGKNSATHIGFPSISQLKSVISEASVHEVGLDCLNLARNNARNMWYFNSDLQGGGSKKRSSDLCCGHLLLNIFRDFNDWRTTETIYTAHIFFYYIR